MSKVDWSLAKSWADRVVVGPLSGKQYWANEERRIQFTGEFDCKDDNHIREGWTTTEFKPKPWSGPEDGLPPVGMRVEFTSNDGYNWREATILYKDRQAFLLDGYCLYKVADHDIGFRPLKTAEQLASDNRETAIRDVMDIAQVDCRVTAARLVDAGFKREVV